jgi:EAL domain-containing protein (putative c-di-GMP-specific phosphodiesterase class I)
VNVRSGQIVGAEVLVRWQDNDRIISPYRFIAIAEESGLIVKIGEWVLQETCQQGRQWLNEGLPPITLAVNVSPHQFRRCDMYELVINTLNKTGFPAELLELEITESSLMEHRNGIIKSIKKLRNAGVRFALDDFGTGYSSLAYLKRFSLDLLKIDRSFINEISTCEKDMRLTEIMIEMGHTLGFKVLAEGVETAEQLAFLRRKNCDLYQGYLKSCPLSAAEFVALLTAQAATRKP